MLRQSWSWWWMTTSTYFQICFLQPCGSVESNLVLPKGKWLHQREYSLSAPVLATPKRKTAVLFCQGFGDSSAWNKKKGKAQRVRSAKWSQTQFSRICKPHKIQAERFIPQSRDSTCFLGGWEILLTVCSTSLRCCAAPAAARKGAQRLLFSRHGQEFLWSIRCQINIFQSLLSAWVAFPSCFFHCFSPSKSSLSFSLIKPFLSWQTSLLQQARWNTPQSTSIPVQTETQERRAKNSK